MITSDLMHRLWPHGDSKIPGLIEGIVATAPAVFAKYGLTSPLLVAHAMAQFSHECGAGIEVVENLNYSAQGLQRTWPSRFNAAKAMREAHHPQMIADDVYNGRMGDRTGSDDGWNYRGRGASQTTGEEGYAKLAARTGFDLLNHPDLVNDPAHFLECGVADFIICGCLPYAAADDVRGVTHHLNGGYIGLSERMAWLDRWKRALAAPAEAHGEDCLGHDDVMEIQVRLRDLGYAEAGDPDGKWGSRTTGALAAFQRHEMLSVTGHYDEATKAALDAAMARPVAPARAEATADDLREAGSETIEHADNLSAIGQVKKWVGGSLVAGGGAEQVGLFGNVQDKIDKVDQAKSIWERVHEYIAPLLGSPSVLLFGVVLLIAGYFVVRGARLVIARRVADHRSGVHAGTAG
jgi:putative chitinase